MGTAIFTFERNGTGKVEGISFGLTPPPYPTPSAASHSYSFSFTYGVTEDGTITVDSVPGTYKSDYLTGPLAGNTGIVTPEFHLAGYVSADHKTITLASANEVQKVTIYKPDQTVLTQAYHICNLERVLIRLEK